MRVRKVKDASIKLAEHPEIVLPNPFENKGKWKEVFGNENPIYIEIGVGKGQFIIENATINTDINYIGIEIEESVILRTMEKALEAQLPNLLLINIDARRLNEVFCEKEVNKIYLNFSDPWPKARHAKRRLTHQDFLAIYKNILYGIIHFKTDSKALYQFTVISLNEYGMQIIDSSFDLHSEREDIITTEYEDKFIGLKKPIYYLEAIF